MRHELRLAPGLQRGSLAGIVPPSRPPLEVHPPFFPALDHNVQSSRHLQCPPPSPKSDEYHSSQCAAAWPRSFAQELCGVALAACGLTKAYARLLIDNVTLRAPAPIFEAGAFLEDAGSWVAG